MLALGWPGRREGHWPSSPPPPLHSPEGGGRAVVGPPQAEGGKKEGSSMKYTCNHNRSVFPLITGASPGGDLTCLSDWLTLEAAEGGMGTMENGEGPAKPSPVHGGT